MSFLSAIEHSQPVLKELSIAFFLISNFTIAGFFQVVWLKYFKIPILHIPVDLRLTLWGERLFGESKTVSGFVGMMFSCAIAFSISFGLTSEGRFDSVSLPHFSFLEESFPKNYSSWLILGCASGLLYMAGELPNSFLKRRLGIAPGGQPQSVFMKPLAYLLDQVDSVAFVALGFSVYLNLGLPFFFSSLILGFVIHSLFNVFLWKIGVKKEPL